MWYTGQAILGPMSKIMNKFDRGPLDDSTYQMSRPLIVVSDKILSLYKPI